MTLPTHLDRFDVIVLGLGVMGTAAARELARRDLRVLGLEQHGIPNHLGSSHGESRVIRLAYYEHPDYVPLLVRSFDGWEAIGQECGERLLVRTGGLYMGDPEGEFLSGTLRAAKEHGLEHEVWERDEVLRRFPMFALPAGAIGVREVKAGAILAERAVSALAAGALAAGAELHGHTAVTGWHADGGGVRVETARGAFEAERLVITGGPWSGGLLGELGLPLRVTRQVAGWIQPPEPKCFAPEYFPVWGLDDPDGGFHYGFPILPGRPGLKLARHYPGDPADPETVGRRPGPDDRAEIEAAAARALPGASGPLLSLSVCLYTNTPDGHFLIDRHPTAERVVFAAGFSGHGFKFAPVVGDALADLAIRGSTELPIGFLGLDRG